MIAEIADNLIETAADLLYRFFREEGFVGDRELIRNNLHAMRNDAHHWVSICDVNGQMAGIVTVITMLYIEWGRLGEIGDLMCCQNSG